MSAATAAVRPIRVLVVDDSAVVRTTIGRALGDEGDLELAGTAANGQLGLAAVDRLDPDVVILDLEMPVMDGVATLTHLRRTRPELPVVVFSHLPPPDAGQVFEALSHGVVEFVQKPTSAQGYGLATDYVRRDLLSVVRAISRRHASAVGRPEAQESAPRGGRTRASLIAIASSTGGPDALALVLGGLRPFPAVPVLIVQHMPGRFTGMLAERLDSIAGAPVCEARDGDAVRPGTVLVAPGGRHMTVARSHPGLRIALDDGPKVNFCRPSADVLFRSLAAVAGDQTLAVVLTGMGRDARAGAQDIVAAGGTVITQTPESAVISSMPAAVAPLASAIVPLDHVADEILRRTRGAR